VNNLVFNIALLHYMLNNLQCLMNDHMVTQNRSMDNSIRLMMNRCIKGRCSHVDVRFNNTVNNT
jgi:hypothetical protein